MTNPKPDSIVVLGLDTGIANVGYCVVELALHAYEMRVLDVGHFSTEKTKRKDVRGADDSFERTREISRELFKLREIFKPKVVTFEAMSFVRSASTMAKIGMCFGVVAALADTAQAPVLSATPMEIKKAATGRKDASKEDLQACVDTLLQGQIQRILDMKKLAQGKREHPYDAFGSILACFETEVMRMFRRQAAEMKK